MKQGSEIRNIKACKSNKELDFVMGELEALERE